MDIIEEIANISKRFNKEADELLKNGKDKDELIEDIIEQIKIEKEKEGFSDSLKLIHAMILELRAYKLKYGELDKEI